MIEEIRRPTAIASCTGWSIAYNVVFVLNLASTPFTAYLNEPRPGQVTIQSVPESTSFPEYINVTTAFLSHIYNYNSMPDNTINLRDIATNTIGMRREMTLPFEIPDDDVFDYYVQMPAAIFFGHGTRTFLTAFLTANETSRQDLKPWKWCQHQRLLGMPLPEICLWIDQLDVTRYAIWSCSLIYESPQSIWIKFIYRIYRQYRPLLANLRHIGFSSEYTRYKIVLGDPAYVILSDPFMSFAMAIDIWWGISYTAIGVSQVSQFQDIWLYVSSCFYLSRCVWFAYLGMRIMLSIVKWRQWEASYAPVDPGLLSIATYIYCGLAMSVIATTRMVWMFYASWYAFLPSSLYSQSVEIITSIVVLTLLMATLPVIFSHSVIVWQRLKSGNRVGSMSSRKLIRRVSNYTYNDMKAIILLSLTMKKESKRSRGGTLHKLYQENRYRRLPL
ncbi:hypothetical protein LEN26_003757 [Aphanomyces euteiches]|nr:hypothetical protein AeMF1_020456 [Aphanomyces euteiches]KAH9151938.1 hypothetical protein LEN26_003757 [Aphanomyces euteiches]KAH9189389.1 hypothetical protein AeNC1_008637 [Aphanomyces euteiches]